MLFPPMMFAPANIPNATNGRTMPNTVFMDLLKSKTPAAEVQRPIIKLAQYKETKGATAPSAVPSFCFMNSGKLLTVATSTPT